MYLFLKLIINQTMKWSQKNDFYLFTILRALKNFISFLYEICEISNIGNI